MTSNSSPPDSSWMLYGLASLAMIHALGESFGPPGIVIGAAALVVAAIWLRRLADPLREPANLSFLKGMERRARRSGRREPPPDDAGGSASVPSPLRPRPVLSGGAAKAIPREHP